MKHNLIVRLTKKTGEAYRVTLADSSSEKSIFTWHGKVLFINRSKCLLLVNDATNFTVFIPFLTKKHLNNRLFIIFSEFLTTMLKTIGIKSQTIEAYLDAFSGEVEIQKTSVRTVIGVTNEQELFVRAIVNDYLDRDGVLDINALNKALNEIILQRKIPFESMRTALKLEFESA